MHRLQDFTYSRQPPPHFQPRGPPVFQRHQRETPGYWTRTPSVTGSQEHWCETCDRGFANLGMLERHNQQHQKCNIDGCQFVAHPKIITKHIQMQHSSGLFKKIGNLNNPEEIEKWLAERRNKYPTKLNVERKAAETKEKIARGEKMGLRHERNKGNMEPDVGTKQKQPFDSESRYKERKLKRNVNTNITARKPQPKRNHNVIPPPEDNRKLKPFTGIRDLVMDYDVEDIIEHEDCYFLSSINDLIEDEEDLQQSLVPVKEPTICGALSSLVCDYGSSDEETENLPIDPRKNKLAAQNDVNNGFSQNNPQPNISQHLTPSNEDKNKCKNSDDDSGPEEAKVIKETSSEMDKPIEEAGHSKRVPDKKIKRNDHVNQHKRNITHTRFKRKLPSTLLQKLLHREIRQERNTVLQCVRYVVKHNYFDNNDKLKVSS